MYETASSKFMRSVIVLSKSAPRSIYGYKCLGDENWLIIRINVNIYILCEYFGIYVHLRFLPGTGYLFPSSAEFVKYGTSLPRHSKFVYYRHRLPEFAGCVLFAKKV